LIEFIGVVTGNMREEIIKIIERCIDDYGYVVKIGNKFNNVFRHYPELKQWLKENTIGKSLIEQLYLIYYDITVEVKCKQCGKNPVKFINFIDGYKDCCCAECTSLMKYRS
jgi:hypothetical protein